MTWDQVLDDLDLIRLQAINQYWADHPPTHILVAAYLGIKPKNSTPVKTKFEATDIQQLAQAVGGLVEGRPNDPMLDLLGL